MDNIEDKIGSILSNPEMMQKIMAMAQSLGASAPQAEKQEQPRKDEPAQQSFPDIDLGMLQKVSGLAKQGSIDKEQQALLRALHPYLSRQRIRKLENAMRAAKMARFAASALNQQGTKLSSSR